MKKVYLIFLLIPVIFLNSCEENFSPKTDYKESFMLNCIIRGDTSVQMATVLKSYNVEGYDPYTNSEDPFLEAIDIRVWMGDEVYIFKDTLVERKDTNRYKTYLRYYYNNNFLPKENQPLEIRAILKDGRRLTSVTQLPSLAVWNNEVSDWQVPPEDKNKFLFSWNQGSNLAFFHPKLLIFYQKNENGVENRYIVQVPYEYEMLNGTSTPQYPIPSKSLKIEYMLSSLDSVLVNISAGDPNKDNYTILGAVLELLIFDDSLSKYYSSLNGFLDDFTIRVDESDYTNIKGGLGIFGSYYKQRRGVSITSEYIESFGYKTNN